MNTVTIRKIRLGEGKPKICTSITGIAKHDIFAEAEALTALPCDLIEWRVDWFAHGSELESILEVLPRLREILGEIPLIFTIRTSQEGGEKSYSPELYEEIVIAAANSGYVDVVDVELFMGDKIVTEIIEAVHKANKLVIASNHDFSKTPTKDELITRLMKMQHLGADILKIAVMPQNVQDVLTLLEVTREVKEEKATRPIVTMSMSNLGMISRMAGETFGSAMTFGAGEKASAPGQIGVKELAEILSLLHE